MVKKKVKYSPIGDSISPESTFVQAAIALDVAAQFAVAEKDAKQMNNVAIGWIEMAKALMGLDEDEESGPLEERPPIGFRIHTDKETDVSIDGEESDTTQSEGNRRLHP